MLTKTYQRILHMTPAQADRVFTLISIPAYAQHTVTQDHDGPILTLTAAQDFDDIAVFTGYLLDYICHHKDQFCLRCVETWSLSLRSTPAQWAAFNRRALYNDAPEVSRGPRGFQVHCAEGSAYPAAWDGPQLALMGGVYTYRGQVTHITYSYRGKVPVIHYTWY